MNTSSLQRASHPKNLLPSNSNAVCNTESVEEEGFRVAKERDLIEGWDTIGQRRKKQEKLRTSEALTTTMTRAPAVGKTPVSSKVIPLLKRGMKVQGGNGERGGRGKEHPKEEIDQFGEPFSDSVLHESRHNIKISNSGPQQA